jgi:hypothetical protein
MDAAKATTVKSVSVFTKETGHGATDCAVGERARIITLRGQRWLIRGQFKKFSQLSFNIQTQFRPK